MCCVWISDKTATFALYTIKRLVLYNRGGEFTARYALSTYIKETVFVFKVLNIHALLEKQISVLCSIDSVPQKKKKN
jgi:hypothetical protein